MNKLRLFVSVLSLFVLVILFSCNSTENSENIQNDTVTVSDTVAVTVDKQENIVDTTKIVSENSAKNTKYKCPMNCPEGFSEDFGICPNCGMDLIENPDYKKSEK